MNTKPYLVSSASNSEGVDRYIETLPKLRDSVYWLSIEYDPPLPVKDTDSLSSFKRINLNKPYQGHLQRFVDVANNTPIESNGWYIFTDTADVRFQAAIPDLSEVDEPIIAASESVEHKDNGFWTGLISKYPEFKPLLNTLIHNMGVVAMKGEMFSEFLNYLYDRQSMGIYHHNCDQALYNMFLLKHEYAYHPTLMTCLYDNWDKGNVKKENGLFVNKDGQPYSIIHANGNLKELL